MRSWFGDLDALLRGQQTPTLGSAGGGEVPGGLAARRMVGLTLLLAGIYGVAMGLFAALGWRTNSMMQLLASTVKMPGLFLLTLLVTFPSLYVFSVLAGSKLRYPVVLRLLLAAIVVTVTVAASLAPILAFFTLSTTSYSFMVILNVALLGISGIIGIGFLRRALDRLMRGIAAAEATLTAESHAPPPESAKPAVDAAGAGAATGAGAAPRTEHRVLTVRPPVAPQPGVLTFRVWMVIYGLVGAQMGWLLRPFIGSPNIEFQWFRARDGNFFASVAHHITKLFGN